jgi:hypothetical protein
MTYNAREGLRAKQVFMSFTDAVRDGDLIAFSNTQFTGNSLQKFFGAYYGDLTANSVTYYLKDLGFDSTGCSQSFQTNAYDVITGTVTSTITLTTNTGMTPDAHIGRYVIIKKANGNKVFARITDNAAGTLTLDNDLSTYGVAAADKILLLSVPCGLTMNAFQRIDHIATDFSLTEPNTDSEDVYFLGTSDDAGSQNLNVDEQPQTKMTCSITVRGVVEDLLRLKYGKDTTVPSGTIRYNLGSSYSGNLGFICVFATNVSDVDNTNAVYRAVFCNDIIIRKVGLLDTVNSGARASATIEFDVPGSKVRTELIKAQADDTNINI